MWKQIFKTTVVAGSLDITAACLNAYLFRKLMPGSVLKYVASGMFGKEAFEGSYGMMAWGLIFHFIIAFACTVIFFFVYPKLKFLQQSHLLNSILIGLVAWAVTNFMVIPLSNVAAGTFNLQRAFIAIGILVICIGWPLSYFAGKYYKK